MMLRARGSAGMGGRVRVWLAALTAAVATLAVAPVAGSGETFPGGWRVGVGTSLEPDAAAAGAAAALQARTAYGEGEVRIVLLFAVEPLLTPALIDAVAKYFPKELIYGGEILAPLTPETNLPELKVLVSSYGVGVCVIGGDVEVTVAVGSVDAPTAPVDAADADSAFAAYRASGDRIGAELAKHLADCVRPGRLLLAFGDQFNGSNSHLVRGLQGHLGDSLPMIGGSAGNQTAADAKEIIAGEIVREVNFGVLFCGDFTVGQALAGGTHTPETADKVLAAALEQGQGREPFFGFVFNCRRRRVKMIEEEKLGEELKVFQRRFGTTPFFGGYGPGEIGSRKPGQPPEGTGFSVSAALLFPLAK